MHELQQTDASLFPDADAFCEIARQHELFAPGAPVAVARAPGRLDVMGGIADYSGSLVLTLPIAEAALVAAQLTDDGEVVAVSGSRHLTIPVSELGERSPAELGRNLDSNSSWGAYVLGPVAMLARERRLPLHGLRLLVSSSIPEGRGLSSSAAVEIAALQAVAGCFQLRIDGPQLALTAQRAENLVARAPCGIMDQLTSACGERNMLTALLCRPAELVESIPLPPPLAVWGLDSFVPRAVSGEGYCRTRCAAFMGKRILGAETEYLTELEPSQLDVELLPDRLSGSQFLRLYGDVDDPSSNVRPDVVYPVRAATLHAVEEHLRVRLFAELIAGPVDRRRAHLLGELMYQSHSSYALCGLASPQTDALVDAVRRLGYDEGLIGARTSAGGCGGTVVVLGHEDAEHHIQSIADELGAVVVKGSSDGAALFGFRVLPAAV